MKRIPLLAALLCMVISSCSPKYLVQGPQGGIATNITLPEKNSQGGDFDPESDKCKVVILMHGIFSSKDYPPMPGIAKELAKHGIASISLDFGGHGKSQGTKEKMTIARELNEAREVWNYARRLPYAEGISLLGHSQGGVVASMLAGQLATDGTSPESLILLAPGAVIKEATQAGRFFGNVFDPKDPPAFIKCFGFYKVGREYMLSTQELDIYGTSARFQGPVCIIHGTEDGTVPLWCSEKYDGIYQNSTMHLIEGENHLMVSHLKETKEIILSFLSSF